MIEALFGAAQAFFQPAYSGLLPQTVPEELIQDARALTESTANLAFLIGPVLATALVLGIGAGEAFAFDAATFVLSAVLLTRVRPRPRGEAPEAESVLHELRAGWREVRSRTWVWVTIAVFSGAVLCVYAQWYALAPVIARDVYGGTGVFGLLEAVAGVGAVCGGLLGISWRPARPLFAGMLLVLAWPVQDGVFALGAPLALVVVCRVRDRVRVLAADDLVGDGAGSSHSRRCALARQRLGLDGVARARCRSASCSPGRSRPRSVRAPCSVSAVRSA